MKSIASAARVAYCISEVQTEIEFWTCKGCRDSKLAVEVGSVRILKGTLLGDMGATLSPILPDLGVCRPRNKGNPGPYGTFGVDSNRI